MLNLTRKKGQAIQIGPDITIYVAEVRSKGEVRIGIEAPEDVAVLREELLARGDAELLRASPAAEASDESALDATDPVR